MIFVDISGKVFGRLTVIKFDKILNKDYFWKCVCACGVKGSYRSTHLKNGHTKSCGCLHRDWVKKNKTTHGMRHTRIYSCWCQMKSRCLTKTNKRYFYYGGRGIKICKRWLKFENFYKDMGDIPIGMSLDRIDNNKGYCKSNCRWATGIQQANNKRNINKYKYKGESKTLREWSDNLNISYVTLRTRVYTHKWPIEDALLTPSRKPYLETKI